MIFRKRCAVCPLLFFAIMLSSLILKETWFNSLRKATNSRTFQISPSRPALKGEKLSDDVTNLGYPERPSIIKPLDEDTDTNAHIKLQEDEKINIVFMLDQGLLPAISTNINSILSNTKRAVRIFVFVLSGNGTDRFPSEYLSCFFGNLADKDIHLKSINASKYIDPELYGHMNRHNKPRPTAKEGNYIRFYLHRLLPKDVNRVIYLDVDLVVLDDIGKLWDLCANHTGILSGVFFEQANTTWVKSDGHTKSTSAAYGFDRLGVKLNKTFRVINAGMMVINVARLRYREDEFMRRLLVWAVGDTKYRWFWFDTQFLMSFAFYGEVTGIPVRWNIGVISGYLGFPLFRTYKNPGILHYYGPGKPWRNMTRRLHSVWDRYTIQKCSGHGKCGGNRSRLHKLLYCQCEQGYSGNICEKKMQMDNQPNNHVLFLLFFMWDISVTTCLLVRSD